MPTIQPTNETAKPAERMVLVFERHAQAQQAVPCKVAQSGASALVFAGLAQWVNRGTAIRLCGDLPSSAA